MSYRNLIIGLGNLLSGDDGFGPRIIQRLQLEEAAVLPGVDIIDAHTDLLAYLDRFPDYERVIIVDALLDPESRLGNPGDLLVLEESDLVSLSSLSSSAHQLSPLLTVQLFRRLYPEAKTRISVVALCTDRISVGHGIAAREGHLTDDAVNAGVAIIRRLMTN